MINHFAVAAMSVLTAIALATVVHALIVMVVVGIRRPRAINSGGVLAPVTWFRPLKAGVPDLHAKLLSFMEAVQPGDQILFGVDPDSEAARIVADLSHGHGGFVQVIACRKGAAKNPKVSKLVQLAPAARHELWLIADGESLIDRNFANTFRREWRGADVDVLTAGYRFIGTDHWPQRLDAMSTVLTLWPGLELIRTFGKIRFTLGACTGVRRADIEANGG